MDKRMYFNTIYVCFVYLLCILMEPYRLSGRFGRRNNLMCIVVMLHHRLSLPLAHIPAHASFFFNQFSLFSLSFFLSFYSTYFSLFLHTHKKKFNGAKLDPLSHENHISQTLLLYKISDFAKHVRNINNNNKQKMSSKQ